MKYIAYLATLKGRAWRTAAVLCMVAAPLVGCGYPQGDGVPGPPGVTDNGQPPAPQGASAVDAEALDSQPADGLDPAEEGHDDFLLTEAVLNQVIRGMPPAEVDAVVGRQGVAAGGDGDVVQVLRWTDAGGNSFTARFDEGKLRTRSRLRPAQSVDSAQPDGDEPEKAAGTPAPQHLEGQPVAEIAPGVFVPLERAVASSNSQPMGVHPPEGDARPAGRPIEWVAPAKE